MKRILEQSQIKGRRLFRYPDRRADASVVLYPNYYIRTPDLIALRTGTSDPANALGKLLRMAAGENPPLLTRQEYLNWTASLTIEQVAVVLQERDRLLGRRNRESKTGRASV